MNTLPKKFSPVVSSIEANFEFRNKTTLLLKLRRHLRSAWLMWLMLLAMVFFVPSSYGHAIIGMTDCTSNSFTIEVTNIPNGTLVAQLLLVPTGDVILQTSFDFASQSIVAVRPINLPGGVYHLNLYLNGLWITDASVTICDLNGETNPPAAPGGRTIGFWSNKNGQALITSADLQALQNLCVKNSAGTDFNPTTASALKSWLRGSNARNMASMLSAQLAATYLNVRHGFTDPNFVLEGTLTVNDLITYANSLLCEDGMTAAGDAHRAEQERVKDILDEINNGK
jgi:hypothetical protein